MLRTRAFTLELTQGNRQDAVLREQFLEFICHFDFFIRYVDAIWLQGSARRRAILAVSARAAVSLVDQRLPLFRAWYEHLTGNRVSRDLEFFGSRDD